MGFKTKEQRQEWWYSLTDEEKRDYIHQKKTKKADIRRDREIAYMKNENLHYNCNECIHRITRSCVDKMPDGCRYFEQIATLCTL